METKHTRQTITVKAAETPERALDLWFVDLGEDHPIPSPGKKYDIVSASSATVANINYTKADRYKLDLNVYSLYVDDLPDWGENEGLLKISVDAKDPDQPGRISATASFATQFNAEDGTYAPGFLYRSVYKNVHISDHAKIQFQLYELDTDTLDYYRKVEGVIDNVPELKTLDLSGGNPFISVATKLFDSIIMEFGVNPDDVIWVEIPTLELQPLPGGAFLRSGIYVLMEAKNSSGENMDPNNFKYADLKVVPENSTKPSNHLLFAIGLKTYSSSNS